MVPTSFPESTHCLGRPPEMTAEQCDPLAVANAVTPDGAVLCISCWKLTKEELEEFQRTGRIWLMIWGVTMPPAALSAISPFGSTDAEKGQQKDAADPEAATG